VQIVPDTKKQAGYNRLYVNVLVNIDDFVKSTGVAEMNSGKRKSEHHPDNPSDHSDTQRKENTPTKRNLKRHTINKRLG